MSKEKNFGIVFKQRYKSVNLKSTPVLNAKHLIYIATRQGAIYNRDCGFGLFGRLHDMQVADNINNLKRAKDEVLKVSKRRTVYRAVFSLSHEDALEKDFYKREKWQSLISKKINVLAKMVDIENENFRWIASFHCEYGHPHVHIMYWDEGNSVRQEYIPNKHFEILSEKVRAEFNREIYHNELNKEHIEKSQAEKDLHAELLSMFKEMNNIEPLMIGRITRERQKAVFYLLNDVLREMPAVGSFRYQYLRENLKGAVDRFTEEVFNIPQFEAMRKRYIKAAEQISKIYGNSQETILYNVEKAEKEIYKQLGNILLKYIKTNNLKYAPLREELNNECCETMECLDRYITENARGYDIYSELLSLFPKHRTPIKEFADDNFRKKLCMLTAEILKSDELCRKINHLINNSVKFELNEIEISQFAGDSFNWAERKRYAKDFNKEEYKEIWSKVYKILFEKLYEDSGYKEQARQNTAMNALMAIFGAFSQSANYQNSRCNYAQLRKRRGELSKEARRDKMVQRESSGAWEPEL